MKRGNSTLSRNNKKESGNKNDNGNNNGSMAIEIEEQTLSWSTRDVTQVTPLCATSSRLATPSDNPALKTTVGQSVSFFFQWGEGSWGVPERFYWILRGYKSDEYVAGNAELYRKKGMRTHNESHQWGTISSAPNTKHALPLLTKLSNLKLKYTRYI